MKKLRVLADEITDLHVRLAKAEEESLTLKHTIECQKEEIEHFKLHEKLSKKNIQLINLIYDLFEVDHNSVDGFEDSDLIIIIKKLLNFNKE